VEPEIKKDPKQLQPGFVMGMGRGGGMVEKPNQSSGFLGGRDRENLGGGGKNQKRKRRQNRHS